MYSTDHHQQARERHGDLLRAARQERLAAAARANGVEPNAVRFVRARAVAARLTRLAGARPRPAARGI